MERVVLLMESLDVIPDAYQTQADVYLMPQQISVSPQFGNLLGC